MFRRDNPPPPPESGLTISVTPAKAAWHPGEVFRARITFTNPSTKRSTPQRSAGARSTVSLDLTRVQTGTSSPIVETHAPLTPAEDGKPRVRLGLIGAVEDVEADVPGDGTGEVPPPNGSANDPEWRMKNPRSRSRSVDLEDGGLPKDPGPNKPGLEGRNHRSMPPDIPISHPHARKSSLQIAPGSPMSPEFTAIQFSPAASRRGSEAPAMPNLSSIIEDDASQSTTPILPPNPDFYDGYSSPGSRPSRAGPPRIPSYLNAYGSATSTASTSRSSMDFQRVTPPPPIRTPSNLGPGNSTTIIWAHARLRGRFIPSATYIPPDPLLPLRSALLHQPLGSGGFTNAADQGKNGSAWITFGSGTIGQEQTPSLTGSLFGLAKGLVAGGQGGSLEEERRRIWNSKDLPVLETVRSLVEVSYQLKEGESASYDYTMQLPDRLPPTFRGRALRFAFEVCLSVNIAVDPLGRKQKVEDFVVPVKILPLDSDVAPYDILSPIILKTETGLVSKLTLPTTSIRPKSPNTHEEDDSDEGDKVDSLSKLKEWTSKLLSEAAAETPKVDDFKERKLSGGGEAKNGNGNGNGMPGFLGLGVDGVTVGEDTQSPLRMKSVEEPLSAVTASKLSSKTLFEISRQGEQVAVIKLQKAVVAVGDAVAGVVEINRDEWPLHVCKFSATLMTDERIPYHLLPPSASSSEPVHPVLRKIVSEHHSALTVDTSSLAFSLSVLGDGVPGFAVGAIPTDSNGHITGPHSPHPTGGHTESKREKEKDRVVSGNSKRSGKLNKHLGGLRWLVQFKFGVVPQRERPGLMPLDVDLAGSDRDNMYHGAPRMLAAPAAAAAGMSQEHGWEGELEVVTVEIPVTVKAGQVVALGATTTYSM